MSRKKWFGVRKKGRRKEAKAEAAAADDDNPANIFNTALKLHESGRFYEAYPLYEKALISFENLLDKFPENTQFQSYVATTLNNLGNLLSDMGRLEEAKGRYERALEMREQLLKSDKENTQFQSDVAMTLNNLGALLKVMGRLEEAKERYERALGLVEGQKNQHLTGWLLAMLGKLELEKDVPDPETAQSYLESSIEKLNRNIRPGYPNAVNWLGLCYYKLGEQQKKAARKEKEKNRIKQLAKESSQFYTLAATNYRKAYELPYARMPSQMLIDAYIADTFSGSVQILGEDNDHRAVAILTESLKKLEDARNVAKDNEDQKLRIEGAY